MNNDHPDLEGYGSKVICKNCGNSEPPAKKPTSWCIKYPSNLDLKHKTPQSTQVKSSAKAIETRCICLECFHQSEDPKVYVMSRRDSHTKNRHLKRRHPGSTLNNIEIFNFESHGGDLEKARQMYYASSKNNATQTGPKVSGQMLIHSSTSKKTSHFFASTQSNSVSTSKSHEQYQPTKPNDSIPIIEDASNPESHLLDKPDGKHCDVSKPKDVHEGLVSLNSKVDKLMETVKELKLTSSTPTVRKPIPRQSQLNLQFQNSDDWKDIKNIIDLTRNVPEVQFYSGDASDKTPSVLRCEVCYSLLVDRNNYSFKQENPAKIALRGIGKYSGSLSSGLLLSPEKTESVMTGGNQYWYEIKRCVKQHVSCNGDHSQLHFEALQHQAAVNRRSARGTKVTENFIRIAWSVIKSKSAAQHFENEVAAHISTGSDLGDMGHSRNHFSEILSAMNVWIDLQTGAHLSKPLPSTSFPPHFYITADKSTPQRISNQAIMLCPMIDGERVAIPVNSPVVYSSNEDGNPGSVSGGCADQLARQIIKTINEAYEDCENFPLKSSWQGTCCDGQYQAHDFKETLHNELNVPVDPVFSEIVWDPSHWMNLAILDIRDGKCGTSSTFLKRIVTRAKNIHTMFQRGKMLSSAIALSEEKDLKLRMTKGSCTTRFWSSQFQEFEIIIQCFAAYVQAFRAFGYSEVREYEILGDDFVIDLCAITDVMGIVIDLMVKLQSLSCPCWKICVWWPSVKKILEKLKNVSIEKPPESMKILKANIKDIVEERKFKDQRLVTGWLLESRNEEHDDWVARELRDCEADLRQFVVDIIHSLQSRYTDCVPDMCKYLTAIDLESLFSLLVGERRNGKPLISEAKLEEFGTDFFKKIVEYARSQEHVAAAIEEGLVEIDSRLSHVIHRKLKQALKDVLWNKKQTVVNWFSVVQKESLKPLASVLTSTSGNLMSFKVAKDQSFVEKCFVAVFHGDEREHIVTLNEEAVYRSMYMDEEIYSLCGKELCLIVDIALAKGGPESVVESYYSTMKSQQQPGGQSNNTLSLRTKLDWCLPNVLQGERMIKEVASLYIKGNEKKGLKKHRMPVLCDRPAIGNTSKVMKRIEKSDTRMPFLL